MSLNNLANFGSRKTAHGYIEHIYYFFVYIVPAWYNMDIWYFNIDNVHSQYIDR